MNEILPELTERIRSLVAHFSAGKVTRFVAILNENLPSDKKISQQKFNRIFNLDTRTKKFPKVPLDILNAIEETFKEVNRTWLLAGDGEMLRNIKKTKEEAKNEPVDLIISEDDHPDLSLPIDQKYIRLLETSTKVLSENITKQTEANLINARANEKFAESIERQAMIIADLLNEGNVNGRPASK